MTDDTTSLYAYRLVSKGGSDATVENLQTPLETSGQAALEDGTAEIVPHL